MEFIKLKNGIPFQSLIEYGFEEDYANCEDPRDHYYHLNNYYYHVSEEFRITVNMISRHIDILCLPSDSSVHNIGNIKPLFDLISDGLVEARTK